MNTGRFGQSVRRLSLAAPEARFQVSEGQHFECSKAQQRNVSALVRARPTCFGPDVTEYTLSVIDYILVGHICAFQLSFWKAKQPKRQKANVVWNDSSRSRPSPSSDVHFTHRPNGPGFIVGFGDGHNDCGFGATRPREAAASRDQAWFDASAGQSSVSCELWFDCSKTGFSQREFYYSTDRRRCDVVSGAGKYQGFLAFVLRITLELVCRLKVSLQS